MDGLGGGVGGGFNGLVFISAASALLVHLKVEMHMHLFPQYASAFHGSTLCVMHSFVIADKQNHILPSANVLNFTAFILKLYLSEL